MCSFNMVKLSPSSLNLFLECPRCFWLYVNKNIKRPSIPVATITTGLDRIIKEYFDFYRQQDKLPPILEGKVCARLMHNFPKKGWLEYTDKKIDTRLGGYLDECLILEGNFYAPLDHKTRGTKPENTHKAHQFQMDAYTFLLEQNGLPTTKKAYLVYYIPKAVASQGRIDFDAAVSEIKTNPDFAQNVFYNAALMLKHAVPSTGQDCAFCKWTETINIK